MEQKTMTREEILMKFENGVERFNTDAIFNRCINELVSGAHPYTIIDKLIAMNNDLIDELVNKEIREPHRIIVSKERFDEIKNINT